MVAGAMMGALRTGLGRLQCQLGRLVFGDQFDASSAQQLLRRATFKPAVGEDQVICSLKTKVGPLSWSHLDFSSTQRDLVMRPGDSRPVLRKIETGSFMGHEMTSKTTYRSIDGRVARELIGELGAEEFRKVLLGAVKNLTVPM